MMISTMIRYRLLALAFVSTTVGCSDPAGPSPGLAPREPARPATVDDPAEFEENKRAESGRIYAPTHSHIYTGEGMPKDLAVTLSIHNVSIERDLVLDEVRYYDTSGKLLEEYLKADVVLAPLQTVEYFVPAGDRRGGSGANFVVGWHADSPVLRPLVEAVMIHTAGSQAFAFATRGIPIRTDSTLPETPVMGETAEPDRADDAPPPAPAGE